MEYITKEIVEYIPDDEFKKLKDKQIDKLNEIVELRGFTNLNVGLCWASRKGYKLFVEFFIKKGANDFNNALSYASEGGHKEIVEFFIDKGNAINYYFDFNWALWCASWSGNKELCKFFIEKGATNFNRNLWNASEGDHT